MKKIVTTAAIGLALILQLAFSPSGIAVDKDVPYNGITYFDSGMPAPPTGESAAGGPAETVPSNEPYNGITFFDTGSRAAAATGSELKESAPYNGITVFQ